ncbi:interleukin 15, like isoform X2 [Electrophorus electricus]|uniref:interleukin 15, like isoform X2 n=1 Tax=Electrophorus electricus TaxID=8005 RepID=UPI0015CF9434|nr:interleukin 15, like isoform X2 [Electrophorus electricus]
MEATILFLYLIAVFLRQAKCLPVCSIEAVEMVKSFLKLHPMELYDCKLYTPTLNHYENCSKSMLTCFAKEARVLIEETQKKFSALPRMLLGLRIRLQDKMKTCPDCEVYKEEKAEIFLNTLLNVLQMMNSKDACSR